MTLTTAEIARDATAPDGGALDHQQSGRRLQAEGRFEAAVVEFGLGLQAEPQNADLMTDVGFCLLELGRRQEAAQVFEVAARLDPGSASAAYGYGWAAERLGALEAAQSAFVRAVTLDPRHADALAGLSGLAVRRRAWDEARAHAEAAAALDPRQTDALMNLARVEMGQSNFIAAERRLRSLIDHPHLKPEARSHCRIMLGDALDGQARYLEAFKAYAEGKGELAALHAGAFAQPDAPTAVQSALGLLAEFEETPKDSWVATHGPGAPGPERGHAILLGFPRSGTTLLEQVLATHPDIAALGERPLLLEAEVEFLTRPGGVRRLSAILGSLLEPYRQSYWKRVRDFGVEVREKVFVDKHPLHTLRLPLIHKVFPEARIILALRDPRDVVLSCFRRSFNMNASMYAFNSILGAATYYDAVMRAGEVYLGSLPLRVHRVRYEDVVADFGSATRSLCGFLSVPYTEDLRNFADTAGERMIATPSSTQVGRGLYGEGVGQWRRYGSALEPALPILAPWIEAFGYPPS